ncbi:hypothetical protein [Mesorhizobium sp. M7A.F.Ca.US.011.01.1.1]|uniref:hypothetical protein n=1 Tax=Mesorhizobium sp. M7A.F.Ca.US.011.01.1.1 TaxID=2496741 RepID=UPI0013E290B0
MTSKFEIKTFSHCCASNSVAVPSTDKVRLFCLVPANKSNRDPAPSFYQEPGKRLILVVVVLDDHVAPVMAAFDRARGDDHVIAAMVLAMPMALAVVVKGFRAVTAMVKASSILIDDGNAVVMVTVMLVRGDDD